MSVTLRPYQVDAIERVRARYRAGERSVLLCAPTGAGKTVIGAAVIAGALERGTRVLFLAHRRELIRQTYGKLIDAGVSHDDVGVVMAGVPVERAVRRTDGAPRDWATRPGAPIQVASIDTLRARPARPEAGLVIVDEAHRALAATYSRACSEWYPTARVLGLTATPVRADGKGLSALFGALEIVASVRELIDAGFLVEPRVWSAPRDPDLSRVRVRGGDYDHSELDEAMRERGLVGDIVEHWLERSGDRRTVVFAASVAHSREIVERFVAAGVRAEHLDGEMPSEARDAVLTRLTSGETQVVSNCEVLCEGWDCPAVKCLVLARPTKSLGLYLQQAGRVLRPWNGVSCVILDHAGNAVEHGLPQDPREWSLEGRDKRAAKRLPPAVTCPGCRAIVPRGTRACPSCGESLSSGEAGRGPIEERAGKLVELVPRTEDDYRVAWDQVVARWRGDNARRAWPRAPGWVWHEYRRLYHRGPPAGCPAPALEPELASRREQWERDRATAAARGWSPGFAAVRAAQRARGAS